MTFTVLIAALAFVAPAAAFIPASSVVGAGRVCVQSSASTSPTMLFGNFGKQEATAPVAPAPTAKKSSGRPTAGATSAGAIKSRVSTAGASWSGPAVERRRKYLARLEEEKAQQKLTGVFTPKQMEAFKKARQEVKSIENGRRVSGYWQKVAARVPGQTAAACKAMAQTLATQKAVGTQAGFFGSYIDVIETKDYVDESADVMKQLRGLFAGNKK